MKEPAAQRNAAQDARAIAYNNGYARLYNGTRPATSTTALSGNTLLATGRFGSPAFPSAASGVLTANAITQESSAPAAGTGTFVRCFASDGTTPIGDFSVGVGSGEVQFDSLTTAVGAVVKFTSFVLTLPEGS